MVLHGMRNLIELRTDLDQLEVTMIDHTQATFSTLSTLRVEAEELIKATNEYINKGLEQVREGECLKEQIVASINKNDEVFEDMVQIAYPDAGLDNESNRAEDGSIYQEGLQQYDLQSHHGRYHSRYPSPATASGFTAVNHPDNEEHAETPRRRNVASFSGVDSPNQEGGKFSRPRSAAVAPMITHFSGSSPTSASTPPISSLPCDAGRLKRQLDQAAGYIPGSYKKAKGDLDPENHEIYKLRQTNMTFEAVAKKINTMRAKAGKVGDLTANAVYARYKRNAPLISAAKGEKFQLCELDENMGTLAALAEAKNTYTFDPTDDILLVRAYSDVMADTWKLVTQRVQELGGQYHEPELCARRYGHL